MNLKKRSTWPTIRRFRMWAHPAYHIRVVVWNTRDELQDFYGRGQSAPGNNTRAFFAPGGWGHGARVFEDLRVGEIHLALDHWTLEDIAHEAIHAAFQLYGATLGPLKIEEVPTDLDEPICYSISKLIFEVHSWMWELAPSKKWVKVAE